MKTKTTKRQGLVRNVLMGIVAIMFGLSLTACTVASLENRGGGGT